MILVQLTSGQCGRGFNFQQRSQHQENISLYVLVKLYTKGKFFFFDFEVTVILSIKWPSKTMSPHEEVPAEDICLYADERSPEQEI